MNFRTILLGAALLAGCSEAVATPSSDDAITLSAGGKADLVGTLPTVTLTPAADTKLFRLRCGTNPNARSCSVKATVQVTAYDAAGNRIDDDQLRVARIVSDALDKDGSPILVDRDVRIAFEYAGTGSLEPRDVPTEISYVAAAGTHALRVVLVPQPNVAKVEVQVTVEAREYFGAGVGCFVAGTPIATPYGETSIEELVPGDTVWAYDDETGTVLESTIEDTRVRENILVGEVEISDGTVLEVSEEHPFYRAEYGDYVRAEDLEVGTLVLQLVEQDGATYTDMLAVTRVDFSRDDYANVYNMDVARYDNYFARRILVHNY